MPESTSSWTRYLVNRKERTTTTWPFRLGSMVLAGSMLWLTAAWWTVAIGKSLVCDPDRQPADAILIENFDPDYLLFERARQLRNAGLAPLVFVPLRTDHKQSFSEVALGIAGVMARVSRVGAVEFIPIREVEPISLNAARDIRRFLEQRRIRSVIVVTPLFRSQRSHVVYGATLGAAGIAVHCEPVGGDRTPTTWTHTWHGIQNVAEQWLKLQYYRLVVLPFRTRPDGVASGRAGRFPDEAMASPSGLWDKPQS